MSKTQSYFHPLPIPLPEDRIIVDIPDFTTAEAAVKEGNPTPLDIFIYSHEPAGLDELQFRDQLQTLLDYIYYCASYPK